MPDTTLDWAPVAGDVLDAAGLSRNLYRTDANASVLEIANGRLTHINFDAAFEVLPHHARAGEKGDMWTAGRVISTDYFSDLSGNDAATYIAVVGSAVTFRAKYDVTLAQFHAGAFTSVWRQFGPANAAFLAHLAAPEIKIRTFMVDPGDSFVGSTHEYTQREHPQTVFFDETAPAYADPNACINMSEAAMCRHHNLQHVRYAGGSGANAQLTRGIYTFGLAVLVPKNLFGHDTSNVLEDVQLALNGGVADARKIAYYAAIHRCRFYCRNVTGVAWL